MKKILILITLTVALLLCLTSCGKDSSEGLEFGLNSDGKSYSVTSIGTCTSKKIIIPATYNDLPVTSIGDFAFAGSVDLVSITIPDSVIYICRSSFDGCTKLVKVEFVGNSKLERIYEFAFNGCSRLTDIEIPGGVTDIGDGAFYNCGSLTSIEIPDSVTRIYSSTFKDCTLLRFNEYGNCLYLGNNNNPYRVLIGVKSEDKSTYKVHDQTKIIAAGAFYNCSGLTDVVIPDGVTNIGNLAFASCKSLTDVVIPDSVTSIGGSAFSGCSSLESIVIGDSVTSIGDQAFSGCSQLQFNEYENCKYLGSDDNPYYALIEVTTQNLSSYTIHKDTKVIADSAFSSCSRFASIVIPDSVTSIGYYAFMGCSSLESAVIGDSVTSIGGWAFACCSNLTSVVIGNSVTSIGDYAFRECSSLTSVVIDNSVTSIGDYAFLGCESLTSIVIPDSVTSIGTYAFSGCSSLTSIKYCGTEGQWNAISKDSDWDSNTGYYTITYNYVPED